MLATCNTNFSDCDKAVANGSAINTTSTETVVYSATIPANSVDTVLTFRNVHNMVMGGTEAATFAAFFAMLKPEWLS